MHVSFDRGGWSCIDAALLGCSQEGIRLAHMPLVVARHPWNSLIRLQGFLLPLVPCSAPEDI